MPLDAWLKIAVFDLTGRQALSLILDRVESATEDEVPGLIAALECILSADERPAAEIVKEIRGR